LPFEAFSISAIMRSMVKRWFGLPEVEKALKVSLIGCCAAAEPVSGGDIVNEVAATNAAKAKRRLSIGSSLAIRRFLTGDRDRTALAHSISRSAGRAKAKS
jgi:hypothetical protein